MHGPFPGFGTVVNVLAVLLGSVLGLVMGHRIPERTRDVVTDCLGLVTLLMAATSAAQVLDPSLARALPTGAPTLVVLASLLLGSIAGSLFGIERRLAGLAGHVQRLVAARGGAQGGAARERFVEGWLTTSLLFCVGPLAVLGSLNDGMGRGIDQLALKSSLDLFAALAFAASFGVGVMFSAVSVLLIQGALTLVGLTLGALLPDAHVAALTAVGGLLLTGIGLRLLRLREIPVGDMLPALVVAPCLVQLVGVLSGR